MRYLFFIFVLLTFIAPINEVEAGNTVSVNRGEAMKPLSWQINNSVSTCDPTTDYQIGSDIESRWTSSPRSTSGTELFNGTMIVNESVAGNWLDRTFTCTLTSDPTIFDTSTLRICNNTTHRSDGIGGCTAIPSYTVTFNGNGSTGGSMSNQTIVSGATAALSSNGYTKTSYTFLGWATTPTGAVVYANGANYAMGASNITLYAKWSSVVAPATVTNVVLTPLNVNCSISNGGRIDILWNTVPAADYYSVRRTNVTLGTSDIATTTSNSVSHTGLSNAGHVMQYEVQANTYSGLSSAWTAPKNQRSCAPKTPTSLNGTAATCPVGGVNLTWVSVPGDPFWSGYKIYRNGSPIVTGYGASTANNYFDATAPVNSSIQYYIVASGHRDSLESTPVITVNTPMCIPNPPPPGVISVIPQACGTSQLKLDWADVAGATDYNIYNAMSNNIIANSNVSEYYYSGNPSTLYAFYVRARNASGGESTNSPSNSGTTPGACPANQLPVANAGSDIFITLPQSDTNPVGASASDPDGTVTITNWNETGRPAGAPPTSITNNGTLSPTFSNLIAEGVYTFRLEVWDNNGDVTLDTVSVFVDPAEVFSCGGTLPSFASYYPGDDTGLSGPATSQYSPVNDVPIKCQYTCNAGYYREGPMCSLPDIEAIGFPLVGDPYTASDITFTGSASNRKMFSIPQGGWADLEIDWYRDGIGTLGVAGDRFDVNYNAFGGIQLGAFGPMGPGGNKPLSYTLAAASIPVGNHRYRFNVDTTGTALAESNEVNNRSIWRSFTVNPANVPPVADAGVDVSIVLPDTNANVTGMMSTDPDSGMISTYYWEEVSRPGGAPDPTILNDSSPNTNIENLTTVGNYVFRLTITDTAGATDSDEVTVTVNPNPNTPPLANAGDDQGIIPPIDYSSTVNASAFDAEGYVTVIWTVGNHPLAASPTIVDANTMSPIFENLTEPGTYTFRVEVTDNDLVMTSDEMNVEVQPAPPTSCIGPVLPPPYSSVYAGDQLGFIGDLPFVYSDVDTVAKCEFSCNPSYWWNGNTCEIPDLSVVSDAPADGVVVGSNTAIDFEGTVSNSTAAPIAQGGWAGLEVDWNSDGSYDYYDVTGGSELGAFANPDGRTINYNMPAPIPLGTHQYRFNVDSTNSLGESTKVNNVSVWRTFSVDVPAPNPPGTQPPLNNPPVVANTAGSCGGHIDVSWGPSDFTNWYDISIDNGVTWPYTVAHPATSYTISGLNVNTNYNSIKVRARNGVGSASSGAVSAMSSDYCKDLTIANCTISDGESTCDATVRPWNITGVLPETNARIVRATPLPETVIDSGNIVGGPIPVTLKYGLNRVEARDVAQPTPIIGWDLTANCRPNSFFHSSSLVCLRRPILGISSTLPIVMRKGKPINLDFTINANYSVNCTFSGLPGALPISHATSSATQTYVRSTGDLQSSQLVRMSCDTPAGDMDPDTTFEVKINVIPDYEDN